MIYNRKADVKVKVKIKMNLDGERISALSVSLEGSDSWVCFCIYDVLNAVLDRINAQHTNYIAFRLLTSSNLRSPSISNSMNMPSSGCCISASCNPGTK